MTVRHIVMFSSGAGSWAAAKRVAALHGTEALTLLFADTLMEDADNYRFLDQAAANVGGELVRLCEGRTPWQVYFDERFLGNHRVDPCSKILKRQIIDRWLRDQCDPADTIVYVGIDWTEEHRYTRLAAQRAASGGWRYEAPLCDPPYLSKAAVLAWLQREGIQPPRLYAMGFPHANCGGFCVKAGIGHFANLLRVMPERYAYHEQQEQAIRVHLGRDDITILRDRTGGTSTPLTLRELRQRVQSENAGQLDLLEWGGCGCFVDEGVPA
jgi:3'-phosphoadenosine 5'-phosphosulfate sulfotransferase (PAPS reductase)/FAD synthetase